MMTDNKAMVVMNGKMAPLEKDVILSNRTRIKNDGTVRKKDGNKKMLKNGEYIGMDGKMIDMKGLPIKKSQEYFK